MGNINKMCKHNKPWFDDNICVISNTEVFQYVKLIINDKQLHYRCRRVFIPNPEKENKLSGYFHHVQTSTSTEVIP